MMDMPISWEVLAPIIILQFILMVVALISCVKDETNGPKWLWVIIVIVINIVGPVLYFTVGRKKQ